MIATLVAFRLPPILRRHQLRKQQWLRARQRCEQCGYDVRTTVGNCPECGANTRRVDRTGDLNYVQTDLPCNGCGVTLRGRLKIGFCPACGHRVRASRRVHAKNCLGCSTQAVLFFAEAIALTAERRRRFQTSKSIRLFPREVCLAVRDLAIRKAENIEAARAMLIALDLSDSDKIVRFLLQFVQSELLINTPADDDSAEYVGLFTPDSLFAAGEVELLSVDSAPVAAANAVHDDPSGATT